MKRVILSGVVVFLILAVLAACGGSSSTSTTTVTLAISPTSASVTTGLTQQFTITVTNSTNTAVTWTVNGVTGGTATVGFISSAGLYTAPNSVPNPATVTVTATSQADTSVTTSAQVTVVAPATAAAPLTVGPNPVTMPAGGIQTFSATVSNVPIAVNWTLNCLSPVGACGTITTAGVYTAPPSPPPGGNVTLSAAAKDNSVPPASAVITIQFSPGTLNGTYTFTLSGQNAGVSYVAAGSITFDGNGAITGGTIDINSGGASTATITGGTYHIGTDGRGNATVVTAGGTVNWQFAVVNHSRAFVERFDAGVQSASGTLELQDSSQFTLAGVTGNYAFNLSGANASNKPGSLAMAGAFNANGGVISAGALDVNNAGSPSTGLPLAGAYVFPLPNTTGRGTMTLNSTFGTQNLAYYVVDATHVKVIETDAGAQLVGDMYRQPAGSFTNASFRSGFVFAFLGSTSAGVFGEGGVLALDGLGNMTSGTIDINKNGNPQSPLTVSGTYIVTDATTGRTTLNVSGSTLQYALYPQINGALSMVEIDTSNVVAGRALAQGLGPFSGGSFQGLYAFSLTGTDVASNPGEEDLVGQILPNGGSAISTSSVDINSNGTLVHAALSGSYLMSSSGRGSATLTTNSALFSSATMNLYISDSSDALFLESDGTRVLVGIAQKQY